MSSLGERLQWGLIPAVPVPFRGDVLDEAAQRGYAAVVKSTRCPFS